MLVCLGLTVMVEPVLVLASDAGLEVGDLIETFPVGKWEGGDCEVIEIDPDPKAPEIVCQVRRVLDDAEIGVFGFEHVHVIERRNT